MQRFKGDIMKYFKLLLIALMIVPTIAFAAPKDVLNGKEFTAEKYPSILIGFRNGGVYGYALRNTYMGTYEIKDANKISSNAIEQITWAVGVRVLEGNSSKYLNPQGNATRADVAAMLYKYCTRVK